VVGAKAGGLPSKPHTAATHRDGAKMAKAAPKPAEDAKPLDTKTATEVSKPKADVKPPTITKASADRIGAGGGIRAVIEAEKEKERLAAGGDDGLDDALEVERGDKLVAPEDDDADREWLKIQPSERHPPRTASPAYASFFIFDSQWELDAWIKSGWVANYYDSIQPFEFRELLAAMNEQEDGSRLLVEGPQLRGVIDGLFDIIDSVPTSRGTNETKGELSPLEFTTWWMGYSGGPVNCSQHTDCRSCIVDRTPKKNWQGCAWCKSVERCVYDVWKGCPTGKADLVGDHGPNACPHANGTDVEKVSPMRFFSHDPDVVVHDDPYACPARPPSPRARRASGLGPR
jgi:hypothetical protein